MTDEEHQIEYTLDEAAKKWGLSLRWISQAVAEGKLNSRLTSKRHGVRNRSVPVYVVSEQAMQEFKKTMTSTSLRGIGSDKGRRNPVRNKDYDETALKIRLEIEDRQTAKDMGVSYKEYLSYIA